MAGRVKPVRKGDILRVRMSATGGKETFALYSGHGQTVRRNLSLDVPAVMGIASKSSDLGISRAGEPGLSSRGPCSVAVPARQSIAIA